MVVKRTHRRARCDYQPVSYTLTSRRGTEDEFASMVSTCADAGVGIIVDAVTNHMTAYVCIMHALQTAD